MTTNAPLLLVNDFHPETIAKLDERYVTTKLWHYPTEEHAAVVGSLKATCSAVATASWACSKVVYELPKLQLISCFGVGVDGIDFDLAARHNVQVTNTPDVLNDAVADIAMTLILEVTRQTIKADNYVRDGLWINGPFPFGRGITGKTLGIIGLGRIGEEIAHRASAFKMRIAYHNRRAKPQTDDGLPYQYYPSICELASASDILLCVLPGGENTRAVINTAVFDALGPDGYFINVGRGTSVDESALVSALSDSRIAGAGLDVYAKEPQVPPQLLTMNNVVLLPHIGSATVETRRAMGQLVIDNLNAHFASRPLLTQVSA